MKYITYLAGSITCMYTLTTLTTTIINDQQAYTYCATHKKSFVAIIWPIAQGKHEQIQEIFNAYGRIMYQKSVYFTRNEALMLLRKAHQKIINMQEHLMWYFPRGTFEKKARIFVVHFDSVKNAISCKQAIRSLYDLQYRPIHINDTHPETMELAEFFFNKELHVHEPLKIFRAYAQSCMYKKRRTY